MRLPDAHQLARDGPRVGIQHFSLLPVHLGYDKQVMGLLARKHAQANVAGHLFDCSKVAGNVLQLLFERLPEVPRVPLFVLTDPAIEKLSSHRKKGLAVRPFFDAHINCFIAGLVMNRRNSFRPFFR